MSMWDVYRNRVSANGNSLRESRINREKRLIETHEKDNPSYHVVIVDGARCGLTIVNTDEIDKKKIMSSKNGYISCGGVVTWCGSQWLITEVNACSEVYELGFMERCNYVIKWVDQDNVIREQCCIVKDGTKYIGGEQEGKNSVMAIGDSKLGMQIAKNEFTVKFNRNNRFVIDDSDSDIKMVYQLTKPIKIGNSSQSGGVFSFVLTECGATDDDNLELGIADYYKHFQRPVQTRQQQEQSQQDGGDWI